VKVTLIVSLLRISLGPRREVAPAALATALAPCRAATSVAAFLERLVDSERLFDWGQLVPPCVIAGVGMPRANHKWLVALAIERSFETLRKCQIVTVYVDSPSAL
jgi:hypothetical protein